MIIIIIFAGYYIHLALSPQTSQTLVRSVILCNIYFINQLNSLKIQYKSFVVYLNTKYSILEEIVK